MNPTPPVLAAALDYQGRGWPVAPIYGPDASRSTGCSCHNPECPSPAKHPTTRRGLLDASAEPRLARIWFERHPARGIALATGEASGIWVLDLDGPEGIRQLADLMREKGELPRTVTSRTGGGGVHLLFAMPEGRDVRNSAKKVAGSIDVRGTGGYILLPPSGHVSGRGYAWEKGRAPGQVPMAHAPGWLLELVAPTPARIPYTSPMPRPRTSRYVRAAIERECADLASTPPGARNEALNRAAFNLARFAAAGDADVFTLAAEIAQAAKATGLGDREITRTLHSAFAGRGVR